MAYDEALADRIRDVIGPREGVTERKMFGGIAWMIGGNMAVGVVGEELMVRLEAGETEQALTEPGTRRMEMGGRPMGGFILVGGEAIAEDAGLARWVDCGADYAASLPPK